MSWIFHRDSASVPGTIADGFGVVVGWAGNGLVVQAVTIARQGGGLGWGGGWGRDQSACRLNEPDRSNRGSRNDHLGWVVVVLGWGGNGLIARL